MVAHLINTQKGPAPPVTGYKSRLKEILEREQRKARMAKSEGETSLREQVHREIDSTLIVLFKNPLNEKLISQLFSLLQKTDDLSFFQAKLDSQPNPIVREHIL